MFEVNRNPSTKVIRQFGVAMLVGFGAIGAILWTMAWWKATQSDGGAPPNPSVRNVAVCLWALGVILFGLSRVSPSATAPVYVAWMSVTVPLGIVMSTIGLTLLFVFLLPFFSIIVRLGDPMRKRLTTNGSYWEPYKPHEATLERVRRPF